MERHFREWKPIRNILSIIDLLSDQRVSCLFRILVARSAFKSSAWSHSRMFRVSAVVCSGVSVVCSTWQSSVRSISRLFDVTVVCSTWKSSVRSISLLFDVTVVCSDYKSSARCYRVICSQYQSSGRRGSRLFGVSVACSDNISLVVGLSKAEFQSYGRNVSHMVVFTIIITFVRVRWIDS